MKTRPKESSGLMPRLSLCSLAARSKTRRPHVRPFSPCQRSTHAVRRTGRTLLHICPVRPASESKPEPSSRISSSVCSSFFSFLTPCEESSKQNFTPVSSRIGWTADSGAKHRSLQSRRPTSDFLGLLQDVPVYLLFRKPRADASHEVSLYPQLAAPVVSF